MTNNPDPFDAPAKGDMLTYSDVIGSLLLITVHSVEHGVVTSNGTYDLPKATVAVLDGDQAGTTYENTLMFGRVIYGQLSGKVGNMVLGRLGQGEAKPGQSPPWKLADPTDADRQLGRAHLAEAAKLAEPF